MRAAIAIASVSIVFAILTVVVYYVWRFLSIIL
jgi:hypothetical protein